MRYFVSFIITFVFFSCSHEKEYTTTDLSTREEIDISEFIYKGYIPIYSVFLRNHTIVDSSIDAVIKPYPPKLYSKEPFLHYLFEKWLYENHIKFDSLVLDSIAILDSSYYCSSYFYDGEPIVDIYCTKITIKDSTYKAFIRGNDGSPDSYYYNNTRDY